MTETLPHAQGFRRQMSEAVYPRPKDKGKPGCGNIPGKGRSARKKAANDTAPGVSKAGERESGWNGPPLGVTSTSR